MYTNEKIPKEKDEIMVFSQNITHYFSKLTPTKLTPSISKNTVCVKKGDNLIISEEKVKDPLEKSAVLKEIQKHKEGVKIQELVVKFGDEEKINTLIADMKKIGDIAENRRGFVTSI